MKDSTKHISAEKLAKLRAENRKLKSLLIRTATQLEMILDNNEGACHSANDNNYVTAHKKARRFLDKHFQ